MGFVTTTAISGGGTNTGGSVSLDAGARPNSLLVGVTFWGDLDADDATMTVGGNALSFVDKVPDPMDTHGIFVFVRPGVTGSVSVTAAHSSAEAWRAAALLDGVDQTNPVRSVAKFSGALLSNAVASVEVDTEPGDVVLAFCACNEASREAQQTLVAQDTSSDNKIISRTVATGHKTVMSFVGSAGPLDSVRVIAVAFRMSPTEAADQNANVERPLDVNTIVRFLIQTSRDTPSAQFKLKARKNGTGSFEDVAVGSSRILGFSNRVGDGLIPAPILNYWVLPAPAEFTGKASQAWVYVQSWNTATELKLLAYDDNGDLIGTVAIFESSQGTGWISQPCDLALTEGEGYCLAIYPNNDGYVTLGYAEALGSWNVTYDGTGSYASPPASISYPGEESGEANFGRWSLYLEGAAELSIAPSDNISASGVDETIQRLTGGTGTFIPGRLADDVNQLPAIDIDEDGNTELAWSLRISDPAEAGDYWDLRVYAGDDPLDEYLQTARITVEAEESSDTDLELDGISISESALAGTASLDIALESTAESVSAASGELSLSVDLGSIAESISAATGDLSAAISLIGQSLSESSASANLSTGPQLIGLSESESVATAELTVDPQLDGLSSSESDATGDLDLEVSLTSTAASESQANGSVSLDTLLTGIATSESEAAGELTVEGTVALVGVAASESAVDGDVTVEIGLDGTAVSTSRVSGDIGLDIQLAGLSESESAADAELTTEGDVLLIGVASSESEAIGEVTLDIQLAGAAISESELSGIVGSAVSLTGAAISESDASGTLGTLTLDGVVSSVSAANGALNPGIGLTGQSRSETAAFSDLQLQIRIEGVSASVSSAAAELTSENLNELTGTSLSVSQAQAELGAELALSGMSVSYSNVPAAILLDTLFEVDVGIVQVTGLFPAPVAVRGLTNGDAKLTGVFN